MKSNMDYQEAIKVLEAYKKSDAISENHLIVDQIDSAIALLKSHNRKDRDLGWIKAFPFYIFIYKNYVRKIPKAIEEWLEENPEMVEALELVKVILGLDK